MRLRPDPGGKVTLAQLLALLATFDISVAPTELERLVAQCQAGAGDAPSGRSPSPTRALNPLADRRTFTVKPCHVCFGTAELVEGRVVPVAGTVDEYIASLGAAADAAALASPQGPEEQLTFRFDGELRLQRPPPPGEGASPRRPAPQARSDVPVDNFLRLAGASDRANPLVTRTAELAQPGNAVVAASIDGRDDVTGRAVLAVVDMLGLPQATAAPPEVATKYGRTLIANALEALGDDFL